jgi:hypothetical protein
VNPVPKLEEEEEEEEESIANQINTILIYKILLTT